MKMKKTEKSLKKLKMNKVKEEKGVLNREMMQITPRGY